MTFGTRSARLFFFSLSLATFFSSPVSATPEDKLKATIDLLKRQLELIERIQPNVEREDQARLIVLRTSSQQALEALQKNPLSGDTYGRLQNLIVTYRFSKSFIEQIEAEVTADALGEIWKISEGIAREYRFDESPYTMITLSTFNQMQKLFAQLSRLNPPLELQKKIQQISVPMEKLGAIAARGDRNETFRAAPVVCRSIQALYEDFRKLGSGHAAAEVVLEIQGLNEFYIEFAQLKEELEKPQDKP